MKTTFLFFLFLSLASGPAFSEYFKYVDENGITVYTDDPLLIPRDARRDVQIFHSVATPSSKPANPDDLGQKNKEANVSNSDLHQKKIDLDETFARLNAEKQALLMAEKKVVSKTDKLQFDEKVKVLNQAIQKYEKKRSEFQSLVESATPSRSPAYSAK